MQTCATITHNAKKDRYVVRTGDQEKSQEKLHFPVLLKLTRQCKLRKQLPSNGGRHPLSDGPE